MTMKNKRTDLTHVKRIVLKVGSSLLADPAGGGINQAMVKRLADNIKALQNKNIEVCLVSSGAVALGRVKLGWLGKHLNVHEKQAAAAIGQPMLMHAYQQVFSELGMVVAQMLLTKDDLRHQRRYLNASNTSKTLFKAGVIPIVNENDTVVVEEIKFGDNDSLSALVSTVVDADLVIMMTDVDGLFDDNPAKNPEAQRLSVVEKITPEVMAMAGDVGSSFGTGGMVSKLSAAKIATDNGVTAVILNGSDAESLSRFLVGEDVGTVFQRGKDRHTLHQHWISNLLPVAGKIMIHEQAAERIRNHEKNLMAIHLASVEGSFDKGECVEIWDGESLFAKGLTNYSSDDMNKLIGVSGDKIEQILGYVDFESMVHSDNLVLSNK